MSRSSGLVNIGQNYIIYLVHTQLAKISALCPSKPYSSVLQLPFILCFCVWQRRVHAIFIPKISLRYGNVVSLV